MPRFYTVSFSEVAFTTAVDLFELDAAAEKPISITGLHIAQSTEFGDAAEEVIPFKVIRGAATSGAGTSITPRPLNKTDTAAGFVAERGAVATAGTPIDLHADAWNVRAGYQLWLPEGHEWMTSGADLLEIQLTTAPVDSIDISATIYVREDG